LNAKSVYKSPIRKSEEENTPENERRKIRFCLALHSSYSTPFLLLYEKPFFCLFVTAQTNGFPNTCVDYRSILFLVGYEEFCIMGHKAAWYLLHADFLLSLFSDPEDGGKLPRNVGLLSTDYTALYARG
jgi:hypothetical protein